VEAVLVRLSGIDGPPERMIYGSIAHGSS